MEASIETLQHVKGLLDSQRAKEYNETIHIRHAALSEVYESAVKFYAVGEKMIEMEAKMSVAIESSKTTAEDVMAARAAQKSDAKTIAKMREELLSQELKIKEKEEGLGTRIALKIELVAAQKRLKTFDELAKVAPCTCPEVFGEAIREHNPHYAGCFRNGMRKP